MLVRRDVADGPVVLMNQLLDDPFEITVIPTILGDSISSNLCDEIGYATFTGSVAITGMPCVTAATDALLVSDTAHQAFLRDINSGSPGGVTSKACGTRGSSSFG